MPNGDVVQDELFKVTGQRTVPNIFIHQEHIGGVRVKLPSFVLRFVAPQFILFLTVFVSLFLFPFMRLCECPAAFAEVRRYVSICIAGNEISWHGE
jgi:hypothetical protein